MIDQRPGAVISRNCVPGGTTIEPAYGGMSLTSRCESSPWAHTVTTLVSKGSELISTCAQKLVVMGARSVLSFTTASPKPVRPLPNLGSSSRRIGVIAQLPLVSILRARTGDVSAKTLVPTYVAVLLTSS